MVKSRNARTVGEEATRTGKGRRGKKRNRKVGGDGRNREARDRKRKKGLEGSREGGKSNDVLAVYIASWPAISQRVENLTLESFHQNYALTNAFNRVHFPSMINESISNTFLHREHTIIHIKLNVRLEFLISITRRRKISKSISEGIHRSIQDKFRSIYTDNC